MGAPTPISLGTRIAKISRNQPKRQHYPSPETFRYIRRSSSSRSDARIEHVQSKRRYPLMHPIRDGGVCCIRFAENP